MREWSFSTLFTKSKLSTHPISLADGIVKLESAALAQQKLTE
jgi:hypothetical protein